MPKLARGSGMAPVAQRISHAYHAHYISRRYRSCVSRRRQKHKDKKARKQFQAVLTLTPSGAAAGYRRILIIAVRWHEARCVDATGS